MTLDDDQRQQLAALEARGPTQLSKWDTGALAALRMNASPPEAERIDRLRGQHPAGEPEPEAAPLGTAEGQEMYRGLLRGAADRGECPACGQALPGGRS